MQIVKEHLSLSQAIKIHRKDIYYSWKEQQINQKFEMNFKTQNDEVASPSLNNDFQNPAIIVQRKKGSEVTPKKQDSYETVLEQQRLEARRESNRQSARNGRIRREKNRITELEAENEYLEAENEYLRTELIKAYKEIDLLVQNGKNEAQRTLEIYGLFQRVLHKNATTEAQQQQLRHDQQPHNAEREVPGTSSPSLLQAAYSMEAPSRKTAILSFQRGQEIMQDERRLNHMAQDEQQVPGFAANRPPHVAEYPNIDEVAAAQQIKRLKEELKMLDKRLRH